MWTCPNCSNQAEATLEVCPRCGAVDLEISAADEPPAVPRPEEIPEAETPTEYELQALPDPGGPATFECHIDVDDREASAIVNRLRELGIESSACRDEPRPGDSEAPFHRIRVPLADLPRALAAIDRMTRRRPGRP